MNLLYTNIPETGQRFCIKGRDPKLLIVSGTHGDEYEVLPFVEEAVIKYLDQLPEFLYVPEVSPSAVALRTRENGEGIDVNDNFFHDTKSEEVRQMMKLWEKYRFELFITFHEDTEKEKFFLYDGATKEFYDTVKLENTPEFQLLCHDVVTIGVELFNGIDELNDPTLGYEVKNGYAYWPMTFNDYSSDYWLLVERAIAKQVINTEIPGMVSVEKKRQIVDAIFQRLLLHVTD